MNIDYVISVFAPDRPGIVEAISSAVVAVGANWQESSMVRLSGRFSGIVAIRIDERSTKQLEEQLAGLSRQGLEIRAERAGDVESIDDAHSLRFELVGHDRPGILREISNALADRGVNIVELETHCSSAPMSGEMLFHAHAKLLCPPTLPLEELRDTLEEIGQDLMVDVVLADEP